MFLAHSTAEKRSRAANSHTLSIPVRLESWGHWPNLEVPHGSALESMEVDGCGGADYVDGVVGLMGEGGGGLMQLWFLLMMVL